MSKTIIVGAIAVVAVFAGVAWYASDRGAKAPASANDAPAEAGDPAVHSPTVAAPVAKTPRNDPQGRPVPPDPRLAQLMVTPDNGLIEYKKGADGRVIQEIDKDPNSLGYGKPLRDYVYAGGKVVGVTAYRYQANQVEVIRAAVSYKPDGIVADFRESTTYEAKK
jgi:hypothetical protein